MSSRDDCAWVKNLQNQMHVWNAAMTRLIDVMEQIINLLKHPVGTPQVPPTYKSSIYFGVLGLNPFAIAHPEWRPSGFTRHDGPKFPNNHRSSKAPDHQDCQKQPIHEQLSTWKERRFTRLPAPMSIIWLILLKKGLIHREKEFPWIEVLANLTKEILRLPLWSKRPFSRRMHHFEIPCPRHDRCWRPHVPCLGKLWWRSRYVGSPEHVLGISYVVKDACNEKVWDTLGQPSGKCGYIVSYSAPPSFNTNPQDIIPDDWGGMDEVQNPRPSNWVYKGSFIGAIEEGSSKGKGIGSPRVTNF